MSDKFGTPTRVFSGSVASFLESKSVSLFQLGRLPVSLKSIDAGYIAVSS